MRKKPLSDDTLIALHLFPYSTRPEIQVFPLGINVEAAISSNIYLDIKSVVDDTQPCFVPSLPLRMVTMA